MPTDVRCWMCGNVGPTYRGSATGRWGLRVYVKRSRCCRVIVNAKSANPPEDGKKEIE